jgi:hypothetical protein
LVNSVTHHVLAGRPSHRARQPWGPASTNFWLRIPCYSLMDSVIMKSSREGLQSGAARPGGLADWPPPRRTGQWPLHTTSSGQIHCRGDTYFSGIPNFLVTS